MKICRIYLVLFLFVFGVSCTAQSNMTLAKFKERLNEVMNDNDIYRSAGVWGSYAE